MPSTTRPITRERRRSKITESKIAGMVKRWSNQALDQLEKPKPERQAKRNSDQALETNCGAAKRQKRPSRVLEWAEQLRCRAKELAHMSARAATNARAGSEQRCRALKSVRAAKRPSPGQRRTGRAARKSGRNAREDKRGDTRQRSNGREHGEQPWTEAAVG